MDGRVIPFQVRYSSIQASSHLILITLLLFSLIFVPETPAQIAKYGVGGLGQALIDQLINDV